MPKFKYTVITNKGERIKGEKEAKNQADVVNSLYEQGLTIVSVEEKIGVDISALAKSDIGGLPLQDKVILTKQLATMSSAGIPLLQSLDILIQQTEKESLKIKLQEVYKSVQGGSALSDAFQKVGGIYNEVQINLIAAGEKSGNLNDILEKVADDLEKNKDLRGKILGAMIYPVIIFGVIIVVLVVMMVFMIPQVKSLYESFGATELPFITQILVNISTFFSNPAVLVGMLVGIIALIILYRYYNSTEAGKFFIDRMKLKIPVFGNLIKKVNLAEFCRLTAMLIQSGMPILDVLQIVGKATNNKVFSDVLYKSHDELIKGSSLALSIAKYNKYQVYPLLLIKIIATGEESGKLDEILSDMGKFYENDVNQITSNLTKLMEPFILIVAGGLVALLAVGIYLPMYQLGQVANK
jgi:type IV pilus assembly protein PilC